MPNYLTFKLQSPSNFIFIYISIFNQSIQQKSKMIITTPTSLLSSLLFLSLHLLHTRAATNCTPSSCGIITDISPPFRLNSTPSSCGDPRFELSCENDVASLYLNSQKFYVKEINYLISRIRLVDASISNDTCSFPNSSASDYNFTGEDPYRYPYRSWSHHSFPYGGDVAKPINLIRCPNRLQNSSLFTDFTDCSSDRSSRTGFDYIRIGRMNASEVPRACGVDRVVMTSWEFRDLKNVSISEIHESLVYGFELYVCSWWWCSRTTSGWGK